MQCAKPRKRLHCRMSAQASSPPASQSAVAPGIQHAVARLVAQRNNWKFLQTAVHYCSVALTGQDVTMQPGTR